MSSEDDGYTHTAGSVEGESDGDGGGPSGTLLVVVVALATLVIPGIIYLYPTLLADHVPFMVAMLALPFIPALLLGVVGVWAMKE
ncbi:hypothetical protein [Halolamina salina]|uniref:Cox cluster protein n=1 Tax=Halolamina salina TaxID=1220023 RepID=A0ABD6B4H5_9EURY